MNTSDGGVVAIHASNPTNPIQIVKGTRPHSPVGMYKRLGLEPSTFPTDQVPIITYDADGNATGYEKYPDGTPVFKLVHGSKEWEKRRAAKEKLEGGEGQRTSNKALTSDDVTAAMEYMDKEHDSGSIWEVGGKYAWLEGLVGNPSDTPTAIVRDMLLPVASRIAVDTLRKIRQDSPTGAALGNVSDKDVELVKSVKGSFNTKQRKEDLYYNLGRLQVIEDVLFGGTSSVDDNYHIRDVKPDGTVEYRLDENGQRVDVRTLFPPRPGTRKINPADGKTYEFQGMQNKRSNWKEVK
jgi:hypothetical protein